MRTRQTPTTAGLAPRWWSLRKTGISSGKSISWIRAKLLVREFYIRVEEFMIYSHGFTANSPHNFTANSKLRNDSGAASTSSPSKDWCTSQFGDAFEPFQSVVSNENTPHNIAMPHHPDYAVSWPHKLTSGILRPAIERVARLLGAIDILT